MKKRTVITNVPIKLPINGTVLYGFLLWYFDVKPIWLGVFITLAAIFWVLVIIIRLNERRIDLDDAPFKPGAVKSRWQQRIDELKNKE